MREKSIQLKNSMFLMIDMFRKKWCDTVKPYLHSDKSPALISEEEEEPLHPYRPL